MRYFWRSAAIALGLLLARPAAAGGPPSIYNPPILKNPIVQSSKGCTAFYIGHGGLLVTAAHCVFSRFTEQFTFTDGTTVTGTLAFLANVETGHDDIAVYRISDALIRPLKVDCTIPVVGSIVHMTGYPGVYGRATVWGRIADEGPPKPKGYWPAVIKINISAFGGFSGSPVMDESGAVRGILVGGLGAQPNLALMVGTPRLCELIHYASV
jgi:S1-C subfamily serine protease